MALVRPNQTVSLRHPAGYSVVVHPTDRVRDSDDELVDAYPWAFDKVDQLGRPIVESATAAPGESRTVKSTSRRTAKKKAQKLSDPTE